MGVQITCTGDVFVVSIILSVSLLVFCHEEMMKRHSERGAGIATPQELAASPQSTTYSVFVFRDDEGCGMKCSET